MSAATSCNPISVRKVQSPDADKAREDQLIQRAIRVLEKRLFHRESPLTLTNPIDVGRYIRLKLAPGAERGVRGPVLGPSPTADCI